MGDADGPPESSGGRSGNDLPVMPGPEKPLLHIAIEFVESLDNALAEQQMLNVAHGELPADAACIIDVPIDAVALPDPGDRGRSRQESDGCLASEVLRTGGAVRHSL